MKKVFIFIFVIITFCSTIKAIENSGLKDIYEEQLKASGADKLSEHLPKESHESLERMGISVSEPQKNLHLDISKIFAEIFNSFKKNMSYPFSSLMPIIAIILICTLVNNLKSSFGNEQIAKIMSSVSTLCICTAIIIPISKTINQSALIIKSSAGFTLCAAPVMTAIMIVSGHPISATSYQTIIIAAGQIISHIAGNFLIPFMKALLGISIVSSVSPGLNLKSLCDGFYNIIKFILKFATSIFTGILTLQNLISSSADNLQTDTIKFAIDSCVPIVGGALSDAFTTVQGCIKLLKSGVGVFQIIASLIIFLPIITQCAAWILFLSFSTSLSDIFELNNISCLFKSIKNIISIILATILSVIVILTVSTVILLIIGR